MRCNTKIDNRIYLLSLHDTLIFHTDSPTNEYENQQAPCNTIKGGKNLNGGASGRGFGIATSKGSGLREPINMAVLRLRESGQLGINYNFICYS